MHVIEVGNIKVNVTNINNNDYICISDFTKFKEGKLTSDGIIRSWLRNGITLEFLRTWELIYNPNFNYVEFDGVIKTAGLHTFNLFYILNKCSCVFAFLCYNIFIQIHMVRGNINEKKE